REGKKALLLLVRRSTGTVPLALGPATWERAVATAPPPPPPEAPSVRALVATPAPAPVAPEAHASLDELEGELRALAPADRTPGQLADYSHRLLRLHRRSRRWLRVMSRGPASSTACARCSATSTPRRSRGPRTSRCASASAGPATCRRARRSRRRSSPTPRPPPLSRNSRSCATRCRATPARG